MTRGEDFARFERTHEVPKPPSPKFATEDERWLISHDAERVDPSGIARLDPRDALASTAARVAARPLPALA